MISLIDFEKELLIPIEEAIELCVQYEEDLRIGIQHNELKKLSMADFYKTDCIEDHGKYYKDKQHVSDGDHIESYYLYDKYTEDIDYVYVAKEDHLVDLTEFAPICKYKFIVRKTINS